MKRITNILLIAVLTLFATSCEEVMEIDESGLESPLVLNAIPSNGNRMFVNFTKTRFFLDDYNHPLDDVDMTLYVNGVPQYPDSTSGCNYFFPYTATADDSLYISIFHNGKSVSAQTYIPRMPSLSNISARIDSTLFRMVVIKFNVADNANYDEYYHINVMERDSGMRFNPFTEKFDTIDTTYNPYFVCFDSRITSPAVSVSNSLGGYFYKDMLYTDELVDGSNYSVTLMVLKLVDTNEVEPYIHDYTLCVESVTPERLDYLSQVSSAQSATTMFAEPSQVTGNVKGALGIFAGTAKQLVHLDIDTTSAGQTTSPMPEIDKSALLSAYRKISKK